jgi:hypothetical protein
MCAEANFKLLKYSKLTPLYQAQFVPNNNCKIGSFNIVKGFCYEVPEEQELEKLDYPIGFNSDIDELKALYFSVANKLSGSDWRISEVKQHSYQELYTFEHCSKKKIRVRFTYDKNVTIKTLTFPDESNEKELTTELQALLDTSISVNVPRLNSALEAIVSFLDTSDYTVVRAKGRSEWEMLVDITNNAESIELKVYVGKNGMVSKIMPEKASSEKVINFFREALNE